MRPFSSRAPSTVGSEHGERCHQRARLSSAPTRDSHPRGWHTGPGEPTLAAELKQKRPPEALLTSPEADHPFLGPRWAACGLL